jgi:hypothetical protein
MFERNGKKIFVDIEFLADSRVRVACVANYNSAATKSPASLVA